MFNDLPLTPITQRESDTAPQKYLNERNSPNKERETQRIEVVRSPRLERLQNR